jgi:hypothetical protein
MNEKAVFDFVLLLLGYLFAFGCGYFLCKSRDTGLADNTGVCDKLSDSIEGSKDTAGDVADRLGDLIESGSDIEAIFNKYRESAPEDKKLE